MNETNESSDAPVVLIVDDNRDIADVYNQYLEPDYDVITAYDGLEALEKLHSEVDVVLLDRRMPEAHGDEVLAEIRDRTNIDCRVVMVTAVAPSADVISLDFDDYLVKPVSEDTLRDAVDRMLARTVLDDELLNAFAHASKMATLEAKMDPKALESSEEYAELEAQFDEYRDLFDKIDPKDNLYAELSAMKLNALFAEK